MSDYSSNFPTQSPTFAFDAKAGKLDSRLSYSRSSSGTYLSNEKALNSENLLPYSNDLSQSAWTKSRVTVASTNNTAPDGTATASSVLEDTSTDSHTFYDNFSCVSGQQYSFVYYFKANGRTKLSISPQATATIATVQFDLTAVTSTVLSGSADSHSITAIGTTGWYKCVVTVTATATGTGYSQVNLRDASGNYIYTGDVTKGVYAWGASVSSTGQTVVNQTSGSIHREYSPVLKTAAADEPRFEYASDGQSEGLLIESQATSLITYSEDFSNSFWTKTRLSIDSNVAVAPDGSLTASALRMDGTAASSHRVRFLYDPSGATPQTFSLFAKAGNVNYLAVKFDTSGGTFGGEIAYFNLSNGTAENVSSGITTIVKDCGNGWFRVSATLTANASGNNGQIELFVTDTATTVNTDGNSYDYLLAWGAMVEANTSAPSSYIKSNSGSSTSRAADSCSMVDATLFDNGGGTLFAEVSPNNLGSTFSGIASINAGGLSDRVELVFNNAAARATVVADGTTYSTQSGGSYTAGNAIKSCLTYANDSVSYYVNGTEIGTTDTSSVMPVINTLSVGNTATGSWPLNGHMRRVAVYSDSISETSAAALTS